MVIEDINEKQQVQERPKRPEKPAKPAPVKTKSPDKKTGGKALTAAVICLLAAAVCTAAFLTVTQNLFGGRDALIGMLTAMDPGYSSLQAREDDLAKREQDVTKREEAAAKKETSLKEEQKTLEEKALTQRSSTFETYMAGISEERLEQLRQVAQIYSSMDPEKAAEVIQQLSGTDDMAVVIYNMKAEDAAELMNYLDKEIATEITEKMLK